MSTTTTESLATEATALWYGLWPDGNGGAYWWFGGIGEEPVADHVPSGVLGPLLERLDAALPQQFPGEDQTAAVERARVGALASPDLEGALSRDLGRALLPKALTERLPTSAAADPPVIVIAAGPTLSRVPFELLIEPDTGQRLIELAVIRGGISPGNLHGRARTPRPPGTGEPLRILDPSPFEHRVFSGEADKALEPWWDRSEELVLREHEDGPTDRDRLSALLKTDPPPSRLMYFGHATSGTADSPAAAALLLRDGLFTAADWLKEPDRWPAPHRVAFIACHSNDTHNVEQMGLVHAAANAGAHTITSTRWTLPTDAYAPGGDTGATPTNDLALAVDDAHDQDDPLRSLREWQLRRLNDWRHGHVDAAPLLWATPVTYHTSYGDQRA